MTGNLTPWRLLDGGVMRSPQLWQGDMEAPLPATAGSEFLPKARLQLCGHRNRRVGDSGAPVKTFTSIMRWPVAPRSLEPDGVSAEASVGLLLSPWTCVSVEVRVAGWTSERWGVICGMEIS